MQIGIHSIYDTFNKANAIFDQKSYPIGEDLGYPFVLLAKKLRERGVSIDTLDQHQIDDFEKIIFLDLPIKNNTNLSRLHEKGIELFLVILESPIVKKDNWIIENHKFFKKVFTWNDDWVDNRKYIPLKLANKIRSKVNDFPSSRNRMCTIIAGKKKNKDVRELYTERVKAIEWFEKNHPEDFDLYGIGWDMYTFSRPFSRFNRFTSLRKLLAKKYRTYKGTIVSKSEVLSKYNFSICYENALDIPGYITEKIFDCFFAGCIPIYLGAPNIADFVPRNCFIDKRAFATYEELYSYMKNMSIIDYQKHIDNIELFISSSEIHLFSADCFTDTIIQHIDI